MDLIYDLTLALIFHEVIGIIKRKALIKELAAVYHAECLAYCQELLELQRKWDEVSYNTMYCVVKSLNTYDVVDSLVLNV